MAFSKTPTDWIANWSSDDVTITIPLATFSELTAAEADPDDGDIRDIAFAIIEHLWDTYNSTASADLPNKMKITKTATYNPVYDKITSRYIFTIETDIGTQDVRDETSSSPSSTPSHTVSATPTSSPSHTASHTVSHTVSHTPSHTASHTPSHTASHTPSGSASPSHTPSQSLSSSPSSSPSSTPSHTSSAT